MELENTYLEDCLRRQVIFFTGKGGVGKSALAWGTALACERKGAKVTVVSWNPYDTATSPLSTEVRGIEHLTLDTLSCFREYVILKLKFEKVYDVVFGNQVLKAFVRAAPGVSESVIAGKIWHLYSQKKQDLLVVDMPSTGHALSFFQSPLGVQKMFRVGFVHEEADHICKMFFSEDCRIDLVSLLEEMPMAEVLELRKNLEKMGKFPFGYLHLNQTLPEFPLPEVLSSSLPDGVKTLLDRHEARKQLEMESENESRKLEMPSIKVPRFAVETLAATLHEIATHLEKA